MNRLSKLGQSVLCGILLMTSTSLFAQADTSRVWVGFKPAGADRLEQALLQAGAEIHHRFGELNAFALTIPTTALKGLSNNPNIVSIEEDPQRYPDAQQVPYGIDAVQARDVWDANRDNILDANAPTGSNRMICVIDSGIKSDHADFAGVNIVGGYPTGWDFDDCGHGTHVAGTITAGHNDQGVVGVNPGTTSLYIVKVFSGTSCGWSYSSDLVNAAQQCQAAGAHIINMSLGGPVPSNYESQAFANLENNGGMLSVAAAGNDGSTQFSYPASYDSVISVAAIDENNTVASFSQKNNAVELAAPGVGVLSTVPWATVSTITVAGTTYEGIPIQYSAEGDVLGALADGGLCDNTQNWSGQVVLCQRGSISFYDKVMNAQNGGANGVVIYNNVSGSFTGTLGTGNSSTIPAISLSQEDGTLLLSHLGESANLIYTFNPYGSGYEAWNGTSMATPHVSGVAALVWSADTSATNADIRALLAQTALDLGSSGRDNSYGFGLIQAADAWQQLVPSNDLPGTPLPPASFNYACTNLDCSFSAYAINTATVSYDWDFGDGTTATGTNPNHSYSTAGSYMVTLTVTDINANSSSKTQQVNVGTTNGDATAPGIHNVQIIPAKGNKRVVSWSTDEPASSTVNFNCCGSQTDSALVYEHSVAFKAKKGALYEYTVTSTDEAGNTTTAGPFQYQN